MIEVDAIRLAQAGDAAALDAEELGSDRIDIAQHVVGKPERAGERIPVVRRPPELVGAHHLAVVAARAEIRARRGRVGRMEGPLPNIAYSKHLVISYP